MNDEKPDHLSTVLRARLFGRQELFLARQTGTVKTGTEDLNRLFTRAYLFQCAGGLQATRRTDKMGLAMQGATRLEYIE